MDGEEKKKKFLYLSGSCREKGDTLLYKLINQKGNSSKPKAHYFSLAAMYIYLPSKFVCPCRKGSIFIGLCSG